MCLIDDHPCLSPTAPSPSARNPRAVDNARCKIVSYHCTAAQRYSESGKLFRMPAALLCYLYLAIGPGQRRQQQGHPALTWLASVDVPICSTHHYIPYLISSSSQHDAPSCSSCLHVLRQVLSFEVRRHAAASCAIRRELCRLPWFEDTAFSSWQPHGDMLIDFELAVD
jgi:hypothetical protein